MMEPQDDRVAEAVAAFAVEGRCVGVARHGSGHIHDSFAVTCDSGRRYLVQRLNTYVFPDPDALVDNVARVTAHLRRRLTAEGCDDVDRRVLTLVPARAGGFLHRDAAGDAWRAYVFVEGARSHDRAASPAPAYAAARAFGGFQRLLADYDGPRLHEVLPGFHDTRRRFAAFRDAVARDVYGRAAGARAEIDFALERAALCDSLLALHEAGRLPERVTHNDTKINNVLIDDATGAGLCVIDLDTVMPGLSLYDFGDLVRTGARRGDEDQADPDAVQVDIDLFEALVRGWRDALGDALLPVEREHLVTAGQLITFETGLRFLTDHLAGDGYFRVHRPGQNLERCRAQFALVRSLEARDGELRRRVDALGA